MTDGGGSPRRPPVVELVRAELLGNGHHVDVRLALREADKGRMPGDPVHRQQHPDRPLHLPGGAVLQQLAVLEVLGHRANRTPRWGRQRTTDAEGGRLGKTKLPQTHIHTCTHTKRHSR